MGISCFIKIFAIEFDTSLIGKIDPGPDGTPGLYWSHALYKHCWDIGDKTPSDRLNDLIKKIVDKAQVPIQKAFDLLHDVIAGLQSEKPQTVEDDDPCGPFGNPDVPWRDNNSYLYSLTNPDTMWLPMDSTYRMLITNGVKNGSLSAWRVGEDRISANAPATSLDGTPISDYDPDWQPLNMSGN
ncbi:hypothetical protein Tdes44962_MAKER03307 [Teratosphaeria destructans]|uniref:Uncharacterized protein n=1 Tax=Teratosphaeria destructans TaxID=418781 RepID=A0A9W7W1X6_9PEZI|nr:hypothetical protein Tdes44962_MAKER03307 [Teratosphaeria destructans]